MGKGKIRDGLPTEGSTRSTFGFDMSSAQYTGVKHSWRRVSTRQWVRDFRDSLKKYQVVPFKPMNSRYPIALRRDSTGGKADEINSTTDADATDIEEVKEAPVSKKTRPDEIKPSAISSESSMVSESGGKKKKRKDKKDRGSETSLVSEADDDGGGKKRKKKKRKDKDDDETGSQMTVASESEAGEGKRRKKKKKGDGDTESQMTIQSESGDKRKKKKKKKGSVAPSDAGESTATDTDGGREKKKKKKKK